MKTLKSSRNPFKPGSGLFPPYFAGRIRETRAFTGKLQAAMDSTSMHLAVIGSWGIGKTTLLSRFRTIAKENNCVATSTIGYPETTQSFVSTLMRRITSEIKTESWLKPKEVQFSIGFLKLKFSGSGEAQVTFQDFLAEIWKRVAKKKNAILITIDDLDLINDFRETMILIRNTAMELTEKGCKIMFVVSGTPYIFEKMYKAHAPLIRFFEPIELKLLSFTDAVEAVQVPLDNVMMPYDKMVIEKIASVSGGHPYYIQEISNHVYEEAEKRIDENAFRKGYLTAFSDISRDIFAQMIDTTSQNEQQILKVLAELGESAFSEIKEKSNLPKGSVSSSLMRLKSKELIIQKERKYSIKDKLFAEFIKSKITTEMLNM